MADWTTYKGLDVPDSTSGQAGTYLKDDLTDLADRAPYVSSSDPTVNDDSGDGFTAGSLWLNTSNQTLWMCTDESSGAAKWRSLFKRVDNALVLAPEAGIGSGDDGRAIQLDDSGDDRGTNAVDLQRVRSDSSQVAEGDNSAVLCGENNWAFSTSSVVAGGKGNQTGGGEGTILSIAASNPTVVYSPNHGLWTGMKITISGSNSTPTIDGVRTVTVTGSSTFTVPVNVTTAGSTGSWTTSATTAYASVGGGQNNEALGKYSHVAGGSGNQAIGDFAHAEGKNSRGQGYCSHAEGFRTYAIGWSSHAQGVYCNAGGLGAHAEGYRTNASGASSHAEGYLTTASAGHAEGYYTTASSWSAHAEGHYTTASGKSSHAEGINCTASGDYSHVEGGICTAAGVCSHAEGVTTWANGDYSHASGCGTVASGKCAHTGGSHSKALLSGQWARAFGGHSSQKGTAQTTITQLFRRTTDASVTELTIGGGSPSSTSRFTIADGQTLSCFINVVGRKENGGANDHASFLRQVCIRREGSTTALVGSEQTIGTDINPASWGGVSISEDDTNESLKIEVTGLASTNIRWTATVFASETADAAI